MVISIPVHCPYMYGLKPRKPPKYHIMFVCFLVFYRSHQTSFIFLTRTCTGKRTGLNNNLGLQPSELSTSTSPRRKPSLLGAAHTTPSVARMNYPARIQMKGKKWKS